MTKKYGLASVALLMALTACSSGQNTFYWYRPQTGIQYFARDHVACTYDSDNWPYEMPNLSLPPKPETLDLRLRSDADDGIWAFYVALPGSQPVYVNSKVQGQWSMSAGDYSKCMRDRGYVDMYYPIQDRKVGVKYCTMTGCVDGREYTSVKKRRDDGTGQYEQQFNTRYYGDGPYTSHYYGHDSQYFYDQVYDQEAYQRQQEYSTDPYNQSYYNNYQNYYNNYGRY